MEEPDFRPDRNMYEMFISFTVILLIFLVVLCFFASCSPRVIEKIQIEYRDTTIIKETIRDSLIQVPIPLESNQAIVNIDETSHLETSIAVSNAFVTKDGRLHHDLANRHEQTLPYIVPIHYHTTNTIKTAETVQTLTKTVEVPKPLTWWQNFRLKAFPWLIGIAGVLVLWTFRKPLLKLIKL